MPSLEPLTPAGSVSRCSPLPLELWTRIFSYVTDSRYMPRVWLNARQTSHVLKAAAEMAFSDCHLQHTELVFKEWDLGVADKEGHVIWPKVVFKFSHLEGEFRDRAVFQRVSPDNQERKVVLPDQTPGNLFDYSLRRWRTVTEPYAKWLTTDTPRKDDDNNREKTPFPPHVVACRQVMNDTPLPGLEVDYDRQRISVLWKPMLSSLFGEDEFVKWAKKVDYQHSAYRRKLKAMLPLVKSGDIPFEDFLTVISKHSRQNDDRVLAEVRRMRPQKRWDVARQEFESGGVRMPATKTATDNFADTTTKLKSSSTKSKLGAVVSTAAKERQWEDALKLEMVKRMQDHAQTLKFDDHWEFDGIEENQGNFYDGLDMTFRGRTELHDAEDLRIYAAP